MEARLRSDNVDLPPNAVIRRATRAVTNNGKPRGVGLKCEIRPLDANLRTGRSPVSVWRRARRDACQRACDHDRHHRVAARGLYHVDRHDPDRRFCLRRPLRATRDRASTATSETRSLRADVVGRTPQRLAFQNRTRRSESSTYAGCDAACADRCIDALRRERIRGLGTSDGYSSNAARALS